MRQFEYTQRVVTSQDWESFCTDLGAAGWEWIAHEYEQRVDGSEMYIVFFKREVDQNAPA